VQDFNSFSIMFYYIISSTTYQKIGDLFCPVHISGLSHSVVPIYGDFRQSEKLSEIKPPLGKACTYQKQVNSFDNKPLPLNLRAGGRSENRGGSNQ